MAMVKAASFYFIARGAGMHPRGPGAAMSDSIQAIAAPRAVGRYPHARRVGNLLFLSGIGPRDPITGDPLGGKTFWAATTEVRFPLPFVPDDLGFGGAIFADAGTLYGTDAQKLANAYLMKHGGSCAAAGFAYACNLVDDSGAIRAAVGASLI